MTVAGTGVRDDVDRKKDNAGGQVCKYDDRGGNLERKKADAPEYAGKYDTLRCGTGICRDGEREDWATAARPAGGRGHVDYRTLIKEN